MDRLDKIIAKISHCLTIDDCSRCIFNITYLPEEDDYCNCCDVILREALDVLTEVNRNGMANN